MMPIDAALEKLAATVARAGLSADDLVCLLHDGMELDHVMSYVSAVLTRQWN
jgi:hypothetical protein